LEKVEGIKVVNTKSKDVVRHELVQKIIEVYKDESEKKNENINKN